VVIEKWKLVIIRNRRSPLPPGERAGVRGVLVVFENYDIEIYLKIET